MIQEPPQKRKEGKQQHLHPNCTYDPPIIH